MQGLEAGLLTGSTLEPHHIAARQRDAAAFYVGDVVATASDARGRVLRCVMRECEEAFRKNLPIYARPLTKEGRNAMTRRGFVQVSDGESLPEHGKMCKLVGNPRASARRVAMAETKPGSPGSGY
jgi:hypothetical protein